MVCTLTLSLILSVRGFVAGLAGQVALLVAEAGRVRFAAL